MLSPVVVYFELFELPPPPDSLKQADPRFNFPRLASLAFNNVLNCKVLSVSTPCLRASAAGQYLRRELDPAKSPSLSPEDRCVNDHGHFEQAAQTLYSHKERKKQLAKRASARGYINVKIVEKFASTFDQMLSGLTFDPKISDRAIFDDALKRSGLPATVGKARIDAITDAAKQELNRDPAYRGPSWSNLIELFFKYSENAKKPLNRGNLYFLAEPEIDSSGTLKENLPYLPQILGLNDAFWPKVSDPPTMILMEVVGNVKVRKPCVLDPGYAYQWYYRPTGETKPVDAWPRGMSAAATAARRGREEFVTSDLKAKSVKGLRLFAACEWEQH